MTFLSLKNDLNVPSKRNKHKSLDKFFFCILKVTAKRAGSGAGSASGFVPICHESGTLHICYLKSKVSWHYVPLDILFLLDDFIIALFWLAVFRCIGTVARQGGSSGAGEKQASDAAQKGENNFTLFYCDVGTIPYCCLSGFRALLLIQINADNIPIRIRPWDNPGSRFDTKT